MKQRLLFISHCVPFPPDKGDRVRAYHELEALSRDFEITLVGWSRGRVHRQAVDALKAFCRQVVVWRASWGTWARGGASMLAGRAATEGMFRSGSLLRRIRRLAGGEPFDLAVGYSSGVLPMLLRSPAKVQLMDLVDIDSEKWFSYARRSAWPVSWFYRREAEGVLDLERRAAKGCAATVLVTQDEARLISLSCRQPVIISNGVDSEYFAPGVAQVEANRRCLVFTGQMNYRPNVDGVCWFAAEVWPGLRRLAPDLQFKIVGRQPTRAVRALSSIPGVVVTGAVDDVRPYLAEASVVIAPLRIARGIQNKVLEAMAMGRAVVASPWAAGGLEVEVGRDILQAASPAQWQSQILHLLNNLQTRRRMEAAAREVAVHAYGWPSRMRGLVELCHRLTEAGKQEAVVPQMPGDEISPVAGRIVSGSHQ